MIFTVSQGIKEFCAAMIEHPHDWVQGPYEFIHKEKCDLAIWTCNGVSFIKIGGNEALSLAEKFAIARAIKLTQARRLTTPEPISIGGNHD